MSAFICHTCGSETNKLIASGKEDDKLACPNCYRQDYRPKVGLHDSFPGAQSKGLTNGKAWEIENRVQSPDDPNIWINRRTGREAQY